MRTKRVVMWAEINEGEDAAAAIDAVRRYVNAVEKPDLEAVLAIIGIGIDEGEDENDKI